MPTSIDLVKHVIEKKPSDFSTNFAELVTDRLKDLVAARKVDIASKLFSNPDQQSAAPSPPVDTPAPDNTQPEVKDENNV